MFIVFTVGLPPVHLPGREPLCVVLSCTVTLELLFEMDQDLSLVFRRELRPVLERVLNGVDRRTSPRLELLSDETLLRRDR